MLTFQIWLSVVTHLNDSPPFPLSVMVFTVKVVIQRQGETDPSPCLHLQHVHTKIYFLLFSLNNFFVGLDLP